MTYLQEGDNSSKGLLIPHKVALVHAGVIKVGDLRTSRLERGLYSIS